ncbi:hypothetical protein ACI2IY_15990 [Lysobacter enzymogenes]|uniref:hypothetical protein n=1 Tax=Lysobacter enzymogenes TaxID=69 RepID=UPI00384EFE82
MRQVFSSSRLENVEGVAQLLREAGIDVRVTNDRSYKGNRRSGFSYSQESKERPAVWVIRSEDQLRARDLLREAGLIDSTRAEQSHQAPYRFRSDAEVARRPGDKRMLRIKVGLLVCIAVAMGLALFQGVRHRPASSATPVDPAETALAAHAFDGSVAATPRALALAVFAAQLSEAAEPTQCLRLDRADAPRVLLAALAQPKLRLLPASQCEEIADDAGSRARDGQPAEVVEVGAFRPTSKDGGTIEYSAYFNRSVAVYKTLEVKRVGGKWSVVKTVKTVRAMG